jgi:hypothetical protein
MSANREGSSLRSYQGHQASWTRAGGTPANIILDLQHDLRALGYLHYGIDGVWGGLLDAAIRSIRIDLCSPVHAPAVAGANAGGVVVSAPPDGTAGVEPVLADCIAALASDSAFTKLPASSDAPGDNRRTFQAFRAMHSDRAPVPFLAAMLRQESDGRHYHEPTTSDSDSFVVVGLDKNDASQPDRITSRGYGLGQYTLFHHPPTPEERASFIDDPIGNLQMAFAELREKFDGFIKSTDADRRADDHEAEHPLRKLTLCKYQSTDPRYLSDCRNCALAAGTTDLHEGNPVYPDATTLWGPTKYYLDRGYFGVPRRAAFPCDWPYAARRYNGSGINSFHYQARILRNLLM